ncbi:hypothetical protein ScPMuIL_017193 [Solemya velum]
MDDTIIVAATFHRSQRKNEMPHSLNLGISPGSVDLAHCSWVAGSGCLWGSLLYPINCLVPVYLKSGPYPRGNKIEPDAVPNICIVKPHPNRKQKPSENTVTHCRKIKVEKSDLHNLHSLKALATSYIVTHPRKKSTTHLGVAEIDDAYEIEAATQEQPKSERWHRERRTRITASKFHDVCKREKFTEKYIDSFLQNKLFKSVQTSYGIANESVAKQSYIKKTRNSFT